MYLPWVSVKFLGLLHQFIEELFGISIKHRMNNHLKKLEHPTVPICPVSKLTHIRDVGTPTPTTGFSQLLAIHSINRTLQLLLGVLDNSPKTTGSNSGNGMIFWGDTGKNKSHMLHGAGIFTYIYPKNQPNKCR